MMSVEQVNKPTPHSEALFYATRYGWRVVPVLPGQKRPSLNAWVDAATTDPELIDQWWTAHPRHGVGIVTGAQSGIFVLDVDPQHGGDDSLADLEAEHGRLPDTIEAITGGGGRHLIFAWPGHNPGTNAGQLGPGLDIRAEGGFIVAAPTIHPNGRPYQWEMMSDPHDGLTPTPAPNWLLDLLAPKQQEPPPTRARTATDDHLPDWHTLLTTSGASYAGQRTDRHTGTSYELWTRPGKTPNEGTSATLGYGNADNLHIFTPNWPGYHDTEHVTRFHYYTNLHHAGDHQRARRALQQAEETQILHELAIPTTPTTTVVAVEIPDMLPVIIDPDTGLPITPAETIRARLFTYSTLAELPDPEWLIDGWLTTDSLALLHGPPGHGKSFVALDWACRVATGLDWQNKTVPAGNVLYVIAEGTRSFRNRMTSWIIANEGLIPEPGLTIHPYAIDIADPRWSAGAAEVAQELGSRLIIVDTLARNMLTGDESKTQDMGAFIVGLDRLRNATGACVLTLHHQARAGNIRGSIALEGAMDTIVECTQEGTTISLKMSPPNGKQKDAEPADDLMLSRLIIGPSCIVTAYSPTHGISPAMTDMLRALNDLDVSGLGVSAGIWVRETAVPRSTHYRHNKHLRHLGLVSEIGTEQKPLYILTDQGKQYLAGETNPTVSPPSHDILRPSAVTRPTSHPLIKGETVRPATNETHPQPTAEDII